MRLFAYICITIFIAAPALSSAGQPLEDLRQGVEKGIRLLEDPRYEDRDLKKEQQRKLWEVMQQVFDFREFSRRVLASHWKKFTPRQRNQFSKSFAEFLGKFYLGRLQTRYNGERVDYVGQKLISNTKALVEIGVLWKNVKVPVKLRMKKKLGTWKVYDISVLGINAVSNYRAQFQSLLQKNTPNEVIASLKEKILVLEEDSLPGENPLRS
jgi:phospholipid transport system substrate-binding protein